MKLKTPDKEKLKAELSLLGESDVREKLAQGIFGPHKVSFVEAWLKSKEDERASASSAKRDAREEETLRIARSANRIAWAAIIIASIFSALSIIIAIIALYLKTP